MTVRRPLRNQQRPLVSLYRVNLDGGGNWLPVSVRHEFFTYLAGMGISHLWLAAPSGSAATAATGVIPAQYDLDDFSSLATAAHSRDIGLVIDITPSCTDVSRPADNAWWWDVLSRGRHSPYAGVVDADFDADPYHQLRLPYLDNAASTPVVSSGDRLLLAGSPLEFPLAAGTSHLPVDQMLRHQPYRLVSEKEHPNYRIARGSALFAALRQEDPAVFDRTHAQLRALVADGILDGLCVRGLEDLGDPRGYLQWLRAAVGSDRLLVVDQMEWQPQVLDAELSVDGANGASITREIAGVFHRKSASSATAAERYVPRSELHLYLADVARYWPRSLSGVPVPPEPGPPNAMPAQQTTNVAASLLHIMGPGLPVVTAGSELWKKTDSLVTLLARCRELAVELGAAESDDPVLERAEYTTDLARFFLFRSALRLREERPDLFVGGDYEAIAPIGAAQTHVIAFERAREHSLPELVVAVTRLPESLPQSDGRPDWGDTALPLPEGWWRDVLTGRRHHRAAAAAQLFADLPVALLVRGSETPRMPVPLTAREKDYSGGEDAEAPPAT
ncbi:hypothetical protein ONR57_19460 [Hoyosella sp. YIM 151337]|uniref:hypothetical protein n=1 Tax=Hoyosella sp. YIM 151337 TaxID=2992742 RepID=UPI0022360697|nr:hypothetical protein [Hoyosella sp. YIM 151337]MCW4355485.1 hypothetical protein [Hoyosella sp. YIM 151337]